MKISLITPTGDRPEAFVLCQAWMLRQQIPFGEWIVSDDGVTPTIIIEDSRVKVIRANILHRPGENTQLSNLRELVKHVTGDIVCFIEDDDFYDPEYLGRMILPIAPGGFDLVGQMRPKYYNVKTSRYLRSKIEHSCLSNTICTRKCFETFVVPILQTFSGAGTSGPKLFDSYLWKQAKLCGVNSFLYPRTECSVSIKGMPGRPGITAGHRDTKSWSKDRRYDILKKWVGSDWMYYTPFFG